VENYVHRDQRQETNLEKKKAAPQAAFIRKSEESTSSASMNWHFFGDAGFLLLETSKPPQKLRGKKKNTKKNKSAA